MSYNNYGADRRLANSTSARNCADPNQGSINYPYASMNGGNNNSYPSPYGTSSAPNNSFRQQQTQRRCGGHPQRLQPMPQAYPSQQASVNAMRLKVMSQYASTYPVAPSASPNPFTPRPDAPIMVNVSAATLDSAKTTPSVADRGECLMKGNSGVKYFSNPLSWNDILGKKGMNGMRVCMAPSNDPANPNRQLKASFVGQQGVSQADKTPQRVVSFQAVKAGAGGSPPAPNSRRRNKCSTTHKTKLNSGEPLCNQYTKKIRYGRIRKRPIVPLGGVVDRQRDRVGQNDGWNFVGNIYFGLSAAVKYLLRRSFYDTGRTPTSNGIPFAGMQFRVAIVQALMTHEFQQWTINCLGTMGWLVPANYHLSDFFVAIITELDGVNYILQLRHTFDGYFRLECGIINQIEIHEEAGSFTGRLDDRGVYGEFLDTRINSDQFLEAINIALTKAIGPVHPLTNSQSTFTADLLAELRLAQEEYYKPVMINLRDHIDFYFFTIERAWNYFLQTRDRPQI